MTTVQMPLIEAEPHAWRACDDPRFAGQSHLIGTNSGRSRADGDAWRATRSDRRDDLRNDRPLELPRPPGGRP